MAFKPPATRGTARARVKHRDHVMMSRNGSNGMVKIGISGDILKQARLNDTQRVDVLVGVGKDKGLVRVIAGNAFKLTESNNISWVTINPETTGTFSKGEGIRQTAAPVVSKNPQHYSISFRPNERFFEGEAE